MMYINGQAVAPTNLIKEGHNYSTDEQVIGTYIDGKPLYEKTILHIFTEADKFALEEHTYVYEMSNFFSNAEKIWLYDSTRSDNVSTQRNNFVNNDYTTSLFLQQSGADLNLICVVSNNLKAETIGVVTYSATIRYTKTTD